MAARPERLTSDKQEVGDSEGGNSVGGDGIEIIKKSGKLKDQKSAKSQKSKGEKSKKSSKNGNSPNFNATKTRPSFLKLSARTTFNRLQLAFIEASIL